MPTADDIIGQIAFNTKQPIPQVTKIEGPDALDDKDKVKLHSIAFLRAEGRISECVPYFFDGPDAWLKAESHARHQSYASERGGGGYDKCDVLVQWVDGTSHVMRYDLYNIASGKFESLGEHLRSFGTFYSGERCPAHMEQDAYDRHVAQLPEEYKEHARRLVHELSLF